MRNNYWSQTMIKTLKKYLGWDWRILPLAGVIASIVTAILLKITILQKVLFIFPILLILMVCYALAAHDKWKEDTERLKKESSNLLDLQSKQKTALTLKNSPPQQYINFYVSRVILYKPLNDTPYALALLNVSNSTVFDLNYNFSCGKTKLNINNKGEHTLVEDPKIKASFDKLHQCTLNNQIEIEQKLNATQLGELWSQDKHTLARWKFEVKIKYSNIQESIEAIEQTYPPIEWECEHFKIQEMS